MWQADAVDLHGTLEWPARPGGLGRPGFYVISHLAVVSSIFFFFFDFFLPESPKHEDGLRSAVA